MPNVWEFHCGLGNFTQFRRRKPHKTDELRLAYKMLTQELVEGDENENLISNRWL